MNRSIKEAFAKTVVHYFTDISNFENLNFVSKTDNPPNVPQARPIEKFWALCKSEYGKRSKTPKNLNGFKKVWRNLSKKIADNSAKALMSGIRKKLRLIGDKGVYEPLKAQNR
jgi:hypothetical protein